MPMARGSLRPSGDGSIKSFVIILTVIGFLFFIYYKSKISPMCSEHIDELQNLRVANEGHKLTIETYEKQIKLMKSDQDKRREKDFSTNLELGNARKETSDKTTLLESAKVELKSVYMRLNECQKLGGSYAPSSSDVNESCKKEIEILKLQLSEMKIQNIKSKIDSKNQEEKDEKDLLREETDDNVDEADKNLESYLKPSNETKDADENKVEGKQNIYPPKKSDKVEDIDIVDSLQNVEPSEKNLQENYDSGANKRPEKVEAADEKVDEEDASSIKYKGDDDKAGLKSNLEQKNKDVLINKSKKYADRRWGAEPGFEKQFDSLGKVGTNLKDNKILSGQELYSKQQPQQPEDDNQLPPSKKDNKRQQLQAKRRQQAQQKLQQHDRKQIKFQQMKHTKSFGLNKDNYDTNSHNATDDRKNIRVAVNKEEGSFKDLDFPEKNLNPSIQGEEGQVPQGPDGKLHYRTSNTKNRKRIYDDENRKWK